MFMDNETYDQMNVPLKVIGDLDKYLIENTEITMKTTPEGEILGIELPTSMVMKIAECDPNVKGNTATGGGKNAVTETGLKLTVPFFIEAGERIKVDTRTGAYQERA